MNTNVKLILASKSTYRAQLLQSAGVEFHIDPANIDERAVEEPLLNSGMDGADIPMILAQAKAMDVSKKNPSTVIIGSDQTLSFRGELLHKPKNMDEARRRLLLLSGKAHELNSAVVLVKNGELLWQYSDVSTIKFRHLDPAFIGRHLAKVGKQALTSVGAYQIEGMGVNLIEEIKGDFFSIMGLPLISLLEQLRQLELIDG